MRRGADAAGNLLEVIVLVLADDDVEAVRLQSGGCAHDRDVREGEIGEERLMKTSRKIMIGVGAGAVTLLAVGGAVVATTAGDDDEVPITGDALERASSAALEHLGEGRVTETEVGDEESCYEVEVTLEDGTQVDVQLDEGFNVVGSETDGTDDESVDDD